MKKLRSFTARTVVGAAIILTGASVSNAAVRPEADRVVASSLQVMAAESDGALEFAKSRSTGLIRWLSDAKGAGILVKGGGQPADRSLVFLDAYGAAFGLARETVEIRRVSTDDDAGFQHVRLQQVVDDIPVAGGEATIHLRNDKVVSVLARTVPDLAEVPRSPSIDAETAAATMRGVLAKHLGIADAELSAPRLEIFNRSLFDGGPFKQSRLAWFAEAATFDRLEYIWIDAVDGSLLLNFNQQPNARNRLIHDAGNTNAIPGTLVRSECEGVTLDADTENAYL